MSKQLSLSGALRKYAQKLGALGDNPDSWLATILAREQLQFVLSNKRLNLTLSEIEQVNELDKVLRVKLGGIPPERLIVWRDVVGPSQDAWWWNEVIPNKLTQHKELPWEIMLATLLMLSAPLILDIIKRLWNGAPDSISIYGTLLTLLLTASPLVKEGRLTVQWILESLHLLKTQFHAKTRAIMALVVFFILLVTQQWLLPFPLATYYNNMGVAAQVEGNLTLAQRSFQRAVALDPDRVVPCYNIAQAYEKSGLTSKAGEWYQNAIEQDANFGPAYRGLGQTYNEQIKYAQAEKILIAGLETNMNSMDAGTRNVTTYELLGNLGWSYFGAGNAELAKETLLSALELEDELKKLGEARETEYRLALPHFYLAQIYEQEGDFSNAKQQWEDCIRFLDQNDLRQRERYLISQQHLQALTGK